MIQHSSRGADSLLIVPIKPYELSGVVIVGRGVLMMHPIINSLEADLMIKDKRHKKKNQLPDVDRVNDHS
jgi:hypothetical protein